MSATGQLYSEVLEQPKALRHFLEEGRAVTSAIAERIREFAPDSVLIAARGSSDNAARYAQYLFGTYNQLAVGLAVPSLISLYHAHPRMNRALVIGISQSGQSPDIVAVLEEARHQGSMTLALTNDLQSPLASACVNTIPLLAGAEAAVAATKTYTNSLLALATLSVALEGNAQRLTELERVPDHVTALLTTVENAIGVTATRCASFDKIVVVGRGFNYCTAFELALKLQELCYVVAQPYSTPDLLHGPVAVIDSTFLAILATPSPSQQTDLSELLSLLKRRGTRTLVISDDAERLSHANFAIQLPKGIPEWLTPIVAIVAGQLFARALCLARGHDPDAPRELAKVTLTH